MPKQYISNLNEGGFAPLILLIAALAAFSTTAGTVYVANNSKPGDALHGLDQAIENVRLNLASSQDKKTELKMEFAKERAEEIVELEQEGDTEDVLEGTQELEALLNTLSGPVNPDYLNNVFGDLRKLEIKVEDDGSYKVKMKTRSGEEMEFESDSEDVDDDTNETEMEDEDENEDEDKNKDEDRNEGNRLRFERSSSENEKDDEDDNDRDEDKNDDEQDDEDEDSNDDDKEDDDKEDDKDEDKEDSEDEDD